MDYSKVNQTWPVNIAWLAGDLNSYSRPISLSIPFRPDAVIVKSVCIGMESDSDFLIQVASDMVPSQILCICLTDRSQSLNIFHSLGNNFAQNRSWRFEIQYVPSKGTGPGDVVSDETFEVGMMLEFIQFKPTPQADLGNISGHSMSNSVPQPGKFELKSNKGTPNVDPLNPQYIPLKK